MENTAAQLQQMLNTNKIQKVFYEINPNPQEDFGSQMNVISRAWWKLRVGFGKMANGLGEFEMWRDLHYQWMGDLSDKKVLDLGCYTGNQLSLELAKRSKYYVGIDLSESATQVLKQTIQSSNIKNTEVLAVDFLSDDFKEKDFDIVYAQFVFHHFKYMAPFLEKVSHILKKDGQAITFDPMNTFLPLRLIRGAYRPFQKDKAWEFPFTKRTFKAIEKYFSIEDVQGMMGKTKWVSLLYLFNEKYAEKKWKDWLEEDRKHANKLGPYLWKCMRVTMNLKKK